MTTKFKEPFVDCHVHSSFSPDSVIQVQRACSRAVELGLGGLAFTDHLDLDYPNHKFVFEFDWVQRESCLLPLREEYTDKLLLLSSVELGFRPETLERSLQFLDGCKVDFIIMSIHVIDGKNLCVDGSGHYYEGKTKKQALTAYLEAVYRSVCECKHYDVVGHIGYVRRYMPYDDKTMFYREYAALIDAILKQVIADGKGIEVNTSGYRDNLGGSLPDEQILKRYKELGGSIVTVGSDSHNLDALGHSFGSACQMLKRCGFDYIAYFQNRCPVFSKLS